MTTAAPTQRNQPETVAIVGVGLIGGSIAKALKQRGYDGSVVGIGRNQQRLDAAKGIGLIDVGCTQLSQGVAQAGIVVVCTPVDRIVDDVRALAPYCSPGTLVTDAGSVKQVICTSLAGALPQGVTFIGSHPLAGSEKQGFEFADADLFEGRVTVVTPTADTPPARLARLRAFWESLGSAVLELSPADHDRVLAQTSHLPHVVAAALASAIEDHNAALAATGFRDTTRIAAGDPNLWAAILLANADEISTALDSFGSRLAALADAIARRDGSALKKLLTAAKTARDRALGRG